MTNDEFFAAQFPDAAHRLLALRAQDQEFDQICADYQEIFSELALVTQTAGPSHPRYLADLAESVSDLRNSIEKRLQASGCTHE